MQLRGSPGPAKGLPLKRTIGNQILCICNFREFKLPAVRRRSKSLLQRSLY